MVQDCRDGRFIQVIIQIKSLCNSGPAEKGFLAYLEDGFRKKEMAFTSRDPHLFQSWMFL